MLEGTIILHSVSQLKGSFYAFTSLYIDRLSNPPPPVGSEPLDNLAHRIWQSVGPSGPNKVRLITVPMNNAKKTLIRRSLLIPGIPL